jgi:hypothetical protein
MQATSIVPTPGGFLNPFLIARQSLGGDQVAALQATHFERARIFSAMAATDDPAALLALAREFDLLEFTQQRLWRFAELAEMHRWFDVPKCSCPKHLNHSLMGGPLRAVAVGCPVHGQLMAPPGCPDCPHAEGVGAFVEVPAGTRMVDIDFPLHGPSLRAFVPIAGARDGTTEPH